MPKQFLPIGNKPMLAHTIAAFDCLEVVTEIIIAVPENFVDFVCANIQKTHGFTKVRHIVAGGETRSLSVLLALDKVNPGTDIVLIHDGARPFVTKKLVESIVDAVLTKGAVVPCVKSVDTVKQTDTSGRIVKNINRELLWNIQTPQGFTYKLINSAYEEGIKGKYLNHVTDDSGLVERIGCDVYVIEGDPRNIKITTYEDLIMGNAILHSTNYTTEGQDQ